jgi:pyridoxine 5-phosphate synthase
VSRLLLGVNIDHVATLRETRRTAYPDPLAAAREAIRGGADSITVHLREDRRHIQERDVFGLRAAIAVPLNLELAVTDPMIAIAERLRPAYCCLVPERREELTTEGGLDVAAQLARVRDCCRRLAAAGSRVSLFIDAEPAQVDAALAAGAPAIEIHTGCYAEAATPEGRAAELERIRRAARQAAAAGIQVNAGHGLNLDNTAALAALPELVELNIGHSIVCRAVFVGMEQAVAEMRRLLDGARR